MSRKECSSGVFLSRGSTSTPFSAPERACGWVVLPFGGILPCTAIGSSSTHSHFLKNRAPSQPDQSLRQAPPAPQTFLSAFHRARSATLGPKILNLEGETSTDTFHNGTSRSFLTLQRSS